MGRQDGDKDLKAMKDISGKSVSGRWNFEKIEEEEHSWFMQATEMSPFDWDRVSRGWSGVRCESEKLGDADDEGPWDH